MDYVAAGIGESRELDKKRSDKVAGVLLFFVPKIEVEVHYRGLPSVTA